MPHEQTERVMAEIPADVFNFFFNKEKSVFTGTPGARQALIKKFFVSLHNECLRQGVIPRWDPEQEQLVMRLASNITYRVKRTKRKPS